MGNLTNSEDPDEMQHNAAFHLGLHCLIRLKQSSGTKIYHNFKNWTGDHLGTQFFIYVGTGLLRLDQY